MDKPRKPIYVLIMEDNNYHAELLTEILDRYFSPVIIHIVDSINVAFDFIKQTKYDLILSDSIVGGVPLLEHIKEIRKNHKNAPIIVITGCGNETSAAKLIKRGVNEYLVKTKETLDGLQHILEKYLSKG